MLAVASVASVESGTVDPPNGNTAQSAERMSSASVALALRGPALDFHRRTSLVAEAAEVAEIAEAAVAQSAAE